MNRNLISFVVVNSLRPIPFIAAINIARKASYNGETRLIASSRVVKSRDFGDFLPNWYKKTMLHILRHFFKAIIIAENKNTSLCEADILGIKSSLASITCDSLASEETYPQLYSELTELSKGAIEIFEFLKSKVASKVYIFNGRLASAYPIVRRCDENNISLNYYEFHKYSSFFDRKYVLYPFSVHNQPLLGAALVDYYQSSLLSKYFLAAQGEKWKEQKLSNRFTRRYKESVSQKYEVVIFLGSDHEYAFLSSSVAGGVSIGNLKLVEEAIKVYGGKKSMAVRAHPNQVLDRNYQHTLAPIQKLCDRNGLTFYPPSSNISSYELIQNAEVVAIDLSSIGTDAFFLEKDVHIFGNPLIKTIINSASDSVKQDKLALADYLSQILSLQKNFNYVEKFNFFELIILCFLVPFERIIFRSKWTFKFFAPEGAVKYW